MNAENITIEQSSRLAENYPWSAMKINDGQFKMRAVFNTGKAVGCRDFDLSVVAGKSYVLVGSIPTTAGNQTVWKRLETSQILRLNGADSHYCYPQTIKLPATLGELWEELYGHVQPFAHREENGVRFVQAGNTIYHSKPGGKPWKYTTDFLKFFAEQTLGRCWILDEIKKPEKEKHQIVRFHWALHGQFHKAVKDEQGEYGILPCGSSNYFYNLAYDLFVLQDNGVLFDSWLHRLKNDGEFQGVRHEIFAAATCIRAGFKTAPDRTAKPTEFIATHISTGLQIAVEAKSRQRKGVLGAELGGNTTKADIIPLLNRALNGKTVSQPYVVFIDLNLPQSEGSAFEKPWFKEVKQRVERQLGEATSSKPDLFNMVVFTNHPLHYGSNDEPSPPLEHPVVLFSMHPKHPADRVLLDAIHEAAEKFGNIPPGFPVYP